VHEQRIIGHVMKETCFESQPGPPLTWGRKRPRKVYRTCKRKRATRVQSYNYHELGHFQYQCPQEETKANFTEAKEVLLIASVDVKED